MDNLASQWAGISHWIFPCIWALLGLLALFRQHRLAGFSLIVAAASALLFSYLFSPSSAFTSEWETDAALNVAFSYKPIGFLAANFLPAISNFGLVVACIAFLRRRG
jgi:hypothetical protein